MVEGIQGVHGSITAFKGDLEDWVDYTERLENYEGECWEEGLHSLSCSEDEVSWYALD